jgi:glyoxylate/hydroxypyruvate reductase
MGAAVVRGDRARTRPLRIHIENVSTMAPVFQIGPDHYAAAAARHSDLAARVHTTIGWDLQMFDEAMQTADALIGWRFPREDLARRAPRLKWIHMTGAGIEHIMPLDWLPPGAVVTTNSGVHAPKAGEFAAMALLMITNHLPALVTAQHEGRWHRIFSGPARGQTLLIIGVGAMGGAAAERAQQLGMRVLGVRRSGRPHRHVDEMFAPDALHRLLPRADVVLVTAPLTKETRQLVGRRELDLMKPGAGLINMGRARVVDYDALAAKLRSGEVSGAILDVFDPEPLPADSPLWTTPNLVLTPHVSSDDVDRYVPRTLDLVFANVRRFLQGRLLKNRVHPDRQY